LNDVSLFLTKADVRKIVHEENQNTGTMLAALIQTHHTDLLTELKNINTKLDTIMATQAELAAELAAKTAQIRKAIDEVTAKLDALMNAVANAPVTPELRAAADALGVAVQAADDIVPDAPPA
jgi:ElaB/YqjD/DUF883 family membrane-anchored ribosome-binding protein